MQRYRLAAGLAALSLALGMMACGAGAEDVSVGETVQGTAADATSVSDGTTVDSITVKVEIPAKTVFAQTYDRYECTVLRGETPAFAFADAETGELLDAAQAARDTAVEKALDIAIENKTVSTQSMEDEVIRCVQAGEGIDLIRFPNAALAAALAAGNYLGDVSQMGNFDLENAALDHSLNAALTIANQCYFLFGAATLTDRLASAVMLVDTDVPTLPEGAADRYIAAVLAGEWTTEAWIAAVAESSLSLHGDAVLPLFVGAGGKLFEKQEDDIPHLEPNENFSRSFAVMQTAMAASNSAYDAAFNIGNLERILLDDTLLALPMPSLEAGQAYRSSVDSHAAECISVPVNPADPVRTGDILTAYFEHSADAVAPWLYDQLLEAELAVGGDEKLLTLILSARDTMLGTLFGWGDLGQSLIESVGMTEEEYLDGVEMRMAVAERAMEIVLARLAQ